MQIRPTQLTIDLGAILHNLAQARACAPRAGICAVIKANAYGHGMVPVALALERAGIQCFGVALVEEGVILREAGVRLPILVWGEALSGSHDNGYGALRDYNLTPVLGSIDQLQALAAATSGKPVEFHAEIDTGMARLGFDATDLPALVQALQQHPNLRLQGVMAHMACADRQHPHNAVQLQQWQNAMQILRQAGLNPRFLHMANSAAVLSLPQTHENLVRCGLMLYGLEPMTDRQTTLLQPALRWTTRLVAIRSLAVGMPVSYGCRWQAKRPSRIGTLAVGYADGYTRALSNRAHVLVHGQPAAVVGSVCMDVCMVDLTDIPAAQVGDDTILVGTAENGAAISVDHLAQWANTINYEIICGIGPRVPRHYLEPAP